MKTIYLWVNLLAALLSWLVFLPTGLVAANTIWLNFRPVMVEANGENESAILDLESETLFDKTSEFFQGDRSGASAACIAIFFLAFSRFFYMRALLRVQLLCLENEHRENIDYTLLLSRDDPVLSFVEDIGSANREATLARLDQRLTQYYDLHSYVGRLVCLGLYGTLVGLWVGFVQTLGPESVNDDGLQHALSQAVIVVATGALSSISGIGIGQLLVEPMAEHIDRLTFAVLDRASQVS